VLHYMPSVGIWFISRKDDPLCRGGDAFFGVADVHGVVPCIGLEKMLPGNLVAEVDVVICVEQECGVWCLNRA
jgi:hypothetical protein